MAEVGDVNFCLKIQNKGAKIWNFHKKFLSLQRQNVCFDYAAECGEQDLIDTTPFKSHLLVAFIFHISFETHD